MQEIYDCLGFDGSSFDPDLECLQVEVEELLKAANVSIFFQDADDFVEAFEELEDDIENICACSSHLEGLDEECLGQATRPASNKSNTTDASQLLQHGFSCSLSFPFLALCLFLVERNFSSSTRSVLSCSLVQDARSKSRHHLFG